PVCRDAPCPRFTGCWTTTAPASRAACWEPSVLPSSTHTTKGKTSRSPEITPPTTDASLYMGMTIQVRLTETVSHTSLSRPGLRRRPPASRPGHACKGVGHGEGAVDQRRGALVAQRPHHPMRCQVVLQQPAHHPCRPALGGKRCCSAGCPPSGRDLERADGKG